MSFKLQPLILATCLAALSITVADVIVQPGYTPIHSHYQSTPGQSLTASNQQHVPRQAGFLPVYVNAPAAYTVGHPLLHYPHYAHALPRYVARRPLHVVKIGGHKVFHPSWFVGQPTVPLAVHHRFKKSVGSEPFPGKTGKSVSVASDSSINDPIALKFDELPNLRNEDIDDKNGVRHVRQSKNDDTITKTLYGLNPNNMLSNCHTSRNAPGVNNPTFSVNSEDPNSKSHVPNVRDTSGDEDNDNDSLTTVSTSSVTEPNFTHEQPKLQNFPDSRPIKPTPQIKTKPTQETSHEKSMKHEENDPLTGTPQMDNRNAVTILHIPSTPSINDHYQPQVYASFVSPTSEYQPQFYMLQYNLDGCNVDVSRTNPQLQYYQFDTSQAINQNAPNTAYTYWPQTYNHVPSYIMGYPQVPHYYVPSSYQSAYA